MWYPTHTPVDVAALGLLGAMPDSSERIDDVQAWVVALNAWKDAQVNSTAYPRPSSL